MCECVRERERERERETEGESEGYGKEIIEMGVNCNHPNQPAIIRLYNDHIM